MKLLIQLVREILHLSGKSQGISNTYGCGNHVYGPPAKINFKKRNKDFTYCLSTAIDHSCRNFQRYAWKMENSWISLGRKLNHWYSTLPFFLCCGYKYMYMKDRKISGKPRDLCCFECNFLRHFVRPILPRVRKPVPGLTILNINKMAMGFLGGLSCKAAATKMAKM